MESDKEKQEIEYTGVEAFPISEKELNQLNYISLLDAYKVEEHFRKMHHTEWGTSEQLTTEFRLHKRKWDFFEIKDSEAFDLIYFDAFGARVQPELWTSKMFKIMYKALKAKGVLVTYSAKGSVRRAMQEVGFEVERLPGPPGKREMLRALKA